MHMKTGSVLFLLLVGMSVVFPAWKVCAADLLTLERDVVSGGAPVQVTLKLAQPPAQKTNYAIALSGTNHARTVDKVEIVARQGGAVFRLDTAAAQNEEFVDISVTPEGSRTPSAVAHLRVVPAILVSLGLSKTRVVGLTPGSSVTGKVQIEAPAPPAGVTIALGLTCNDCESGDPTPVVLPASILVTGGSRIATFEFQTRRQISTKQITILASYGGIAKTAALTNEPLHPESISVSPTSVQGTSETTVTVTLNAPAYDFYVLEVTCTLDLQTDAETVDPKPGCGSLPRGIRWPAGQSSLSFHAHAIRVTQPSQVTIQARGEGIFEGIRSTVLTVTP